MTQDAGPVPVLCEAYWLVAFGAVLLVVTHLMHIEVLDLVLNLLVCM